MAGRRAVADTGGGAGRGAGGGAGRGARVAAGRQPAYGEARQDAGSRWPAIIVPACYLAAAVVLTWQLWADPASRTVAGNPTDADLFAWYLRYAADGVAHGHLPALVTTAMNAPTGVSMMWNTSVLLPGVLLTPVTLLFGPQASLSILTTLGFAGSAAALYYVLRRWQVSVGAAALAGAVYGFSPALLHSALGHYNLQFAVLPPLIIDAGLVIAAGQGAGRRAVLRLEPRRRPETAAGSPGPAGRRLVSRVPHVVWDGGRLPAAAARRIGPAAAGLAVAATVTFCIAGHALLTQSGGPLVQHGPLFPPDYYVNDPVSFVTPSTYLLFHSAGAAATAAKYQGGATEYLAYLGWPLIVVLALAALVSWRRPAARAAAFALAALVIFSLGGHPLVGGTSNAAVNLPWHWIEEHPLFASVLPDRMSIIADGVAAALLALGIDAASHRLAERRRQTDAAGAVLGEGLGAARPASVVLTVAALCCLPLLPAPLPAGTVTPLPFGWTRTFTVLNLPARAPVLIVPVPTNILTATMRWQADTGQPGSMVGGYFIGPGAGGQAYIGGTGVNPVAWYLDELWASGLPGTSPFAAAALGAGLPVSIPGGGPAPTGKAPPIAQVRAAITTWHPAAVVAVTAASSPLAAYLVKVLGPPTVQSGIVLAWRR